MDNLGVIRLINTASYKDRPIPEVGKEYHVFDDGKIKPSGHSITKVVEVIPFKEADIDLLETWHKDVSDCYWLYSPKTDYFIKTEYDDKEEPSYFARTLDGGWFSLGWFGARLDIDGSLYSKLLEWFVDESV